MAEQAALRQTVERQAEQLVGQAETIGRQSAELEASRDEVTRVTAERDAAESVQRRATRRLAIALAVVVTLAIVALLRAGCAKIDGFVKLMG